MKDLLGNGIFAVDGAKWRHQRKLASFEFSTKNLRDFSTVIFKSNSTVLAKKISFLAAADKSINLQVKTSFQNNGFAKFCFICFVFCFRTGFVIKIDIRLDIQGGIRF